MPKEKEQKEPSLKIRFQKKHCNSKKFNEVEIIKYIHNLDIQRLTRNEKQLVKALKICVLNLYDKKTKLKKAMTVSKQLTSVLSHK